MKTTMMPLLVLMLLFSPLSAQAAAYPEGPVKITVGYAAGGFADAIARKLAEGLTKNLGQPVVVSNMGGSAGGTSAMNIKAEKPDGYALGFVTTPTFAFNPLTGAEFNMDDFTYIAGVARQQEAFVSLSGKPWKNMKEMLAWAKKENKTLTCASHIPALTSMLLNRIAVDSGVKIKTMPTKGGAEVVTSVLGGHVDFGFLSGIHVDYIKKGQMICLAATGRTRQIELPEIPTLQELGFTVYTDGLNIVFGPKGIPADRVERLQKAIQEVVASASYKELVGATMGLEVIYADSKSVYDLVAATRADYEKLYKAQKPQ